MEGSPRRYGIGAAFFASLTILMFGDIFFSDTALISSAGEDLTIQYYHWRHFAFSELRAGNFPLWNPYIFSGAPFFSGFQSAMLYPPNWVYFALPLRQALNLEVTLHFFMAGFFTFCWVRNSGATVLASCLAGAVFSLSTPFFAHIYPGHLSNLGSMAWAPLVLMSIDRLLKTPSAIAVALGSLAIAMQVLAGHPQYVYCTGLLASLYFLLQLRKREGLWRRSGAFFCMYALGASLCAFQILSGLEATDESVRGSGMHYDFASSFYFPLDNLLTILSPLLFGGLEGREYWAHFNFWEMTFYFGIFGFVAAIVGVVAQVKQRQWQYVVPCLLAILVALGKTTPLYDVLYQWLPGIKNFRGISKFIFLAALFVAPMVAIGFTELAKVSFAKRRLVGSALLLLGFGGWIALRRGGPDQLVGGWRAVLGSLGRSPELIAEWGGLDAQFVQGSLHAMMGGTLIICATAMALGAAFVFARRQFSVVFAGIAIVELVAHAGLMRATQDESKIAKTNAALGVVMNYVGANDRFVYSKNPNIGMSLRRGSLWGSDPFVTKRYAELVAASQGIDNDEAAQDVAITDLDHPLLEVFNFRPIFDNQGMPDMQEITAQVDIAQRFALIDRFVVASDRDEIFSALQDPSFDHNLSVVLEKTPDPVPAPGQKGRVVVVDSSTDHVDLNVQTDHPTILLMRDSYSAGWSAKSLIKRPVQTYEVMPANYALMAIPLASGKHLIRVEYRPRLLSVGLIISGVVAFLLLLILGRHAYRERWRLVVTREDRRPSRPAQPSEVNA